MGRVKSRSSSDSGVENSKIGSVLPEAIEAAGAQLDQAGFERSMCRSSAMGAVILAFAEACAHADRLLRGFAAGSGPGVAARRGRGR